MMIKLEVTSEKTAKKLGTFGITASPYKKSPIRGAHFVVNRPTNKSIKLFSTNAAKVEIFGSKKNRQAVLNITEEKRTLVQKGNLSVYYTNLPQLIGWKNARLESWVRDRMVRSCPITVPIDGTKHRHKCLETLKDIRARAKRILKANKGKDATSEGFIEYMKIKVEWKVHVPASEVHLLMGVDENCHFICAMEKKPTSLADAHEILRPDGTSSDALRQGEWFFEPVDAKELKVVEDLILKRTPDGPNRRGSRKDGVFYSESFEKRSTHFASCLVRVGGNQYAIGVVSDSRPGHHKDLVLSGWHKVIRNNEIVLPQFVDGAGQLRSRRWD